MDGVKIARNKVKDAGCECDVFCGNCKLFSPNDDDRIALTRSQHKQ